VQTTSYIPHDAKTARIPSESKNNSEEVQG